MTSLEKFLNWFNKHSATLSPLVTLRSTGSEGNAMFSNSSDPIPVNTVLFSIPRSLVLSTRTSDLKEKLSEAEWEIEGLQTGWGRLILVMMWEESRGSDGKWDGYFEVLPNSFSTPMFWSPDEIQQLQGTSIFDKIGTASSEELYNDVLLPLIKRNPELFPPAKHDEHYTIQSFHRQGSRILSRSFGVEADGADEEDEEDEDEEEDDDNGEGVDTVGMVPMADMLNARWGDENARLVYEEESLSMVTTREVLPGAQVYNTYGLPPNADLLRRYGHVDVIPPSIIGSPADEVEIRADLIVDVACDYLKEKGNLIEEWDMEGRIEFWLEEGGDDIIPITLPAELPPSLIALVNLLLLSKDEFIKSREKEKLPRPKIDAEGARQVLKEIITRRLGEYSGDFESDVNALSKPSTLSPSVYAATVVRAGEKSILREVLKEIEAVPAAAESSKKSSKRKAEDDDGQSSKKSR